MKPLAVDLFCGLGGWSDGLIAEGFEVMGFDIERHDYGTGARYPAQMVLQDVLTIHGGQFKNVSLIVASPPCQEYSYMAMPWSRAKAIAADYWSGAKDTKKLTALFDACFRIQREAIEAAGHFIPLVVENVRGACPWVGRSVFNYGSFHLWGDVPALMPIVRRTVLKAGVAHRADGTTNFHGDKNYGTKMPGCGMSKGDQKWNAHHTDSLDIAGIKVPGFRFDGSGKSFQSASVKANFKVSEDGVKGFTPNGGPLGKNELGRKFGSKSPARKAASAAIAKIPLPLARFIARAWYPTNANPQ